MLNAESRHLPLQRLFRKPVGEANGERGLLTSRFAMPADVKDRRMARVDPCATTSSDRG
ncbi:hypothetical protein [Sphingomonas sp.]|uniref:hypothetical protein n=1 Tax=Sphingomonas sp. TaxID=28214 RepID=UPI003BAAF87D